MGAVLSRASSAVGWFIPTKRGWIIIGFLLLAVISGMFASTGKNILTIGLTGMIAAMFIAAIPPTRMLPLLGIVCCLVIGQLIYFAGIVQALWIPYALALVLYLRLPGAYLESPYYERPQLSVTFSSLYLAFMACVFVSIAVNTPSPLQALAGGKNYVVLWAIYLTIALFAVKPEVVEKLFDWLIPLAVLQIPFVLYQYFVVAAGRSARGGRFGVAWDAIVGSFGGNPQGGGASGVMAYYLVLAVIYTFALWRQKLAKGHVVLIALLIAALCVALAEVKVVVILLPLGLMIVQLPELIKRPFFSLASLVVVLAMMFALMVGYDRMHYAGTDMAAKSIDGVFKNTFGYSTDPDFINLETGEMGRVAALSFWFEQASRFDFLHALVGYAPGATRSESIFAVGELAAKYPFRLDRSTASQMLWEIGAVGSLMFVSILIYAAVRSYRAARACRDNPRRQAILETIAALLVMNLVMWPYGREIIETPAQTFLLMISLGYVAQVITLQRLEQIKRPVV